MLHVVFMLMQFKVKKFFKNTRIVSKSCQKGSQGKKKPNMQYMKFKLKQQTE